LAKRIESKIGNFEEQKPKVIAIEQFTNEAQDVDPNIKLITFFLANRYAEKEFQ
jgi:hypothetical protein